MTMRGMLVGVVVCALVGACGNKSSEGDEAKPGDGKDVAPKPTDPGTPTRDATKPLKVREPGAYELVVSPVTKSLTAERYVVATSSGVSVAAVPRHDVTKPEGGAFPGMAVGESELAKKLDAFGAAPEASATDDAIPNPDTKEEAAEAEVADPNPDTGWGTIGTGRYATIAPGGGPMGGGAILGTGSISNYAPVVLADKTLPAKRVVEVVRALCHHGARLGTAQADSDTAGEHPVWVGTLEQGACGRAAGSRGGAERVVLQLADDGIYVVTKAGRNRVADVGAAGVDPLTKVLAAAITNPNFPPHLWVAVDPKPTTEDLVRVLDAAHASKFQRAYLATMDAWREHVSKGGEKPVARIAFRGCEAAGDLDKNIIRRYVRRQSANFRQCYEQAISRDPEAAGGVVATFTIGSKGDVLSATATTVDTILGKCLADKLKTATFPKPKNDKKVDVTCKLALSQR